MYVHKLLNPKKVNHRQDWKEFQFNDICTKERTELQNDQCSKTGEIIHFCLV